MSLKQYAAPSLAVLAVTLWSLGCGQTMPTDPGGAVLGKGKPPTQSTKVALQNLVLESSTLTIDGLAVNYTIEIVNSGKKREGVILQGEISQLGSNGVTSAVKGAGGVTVDCGGDLGFLPNGTCTVAFTAQASNSTGGFGTLVPGPATLSLAVLLGDGTRLASTSISINLQQ
jgi:hypothetical protein